MYDELLAVRGGAAGGDDAHMPLLRLRLLRSALAVLRDAAVRSQTALYRMRLQQSAACCPG